MPRVRHSRVGGGHPNRNLFLGSNSEFFVIKPQKQANHETKIVAVFLKHLVCLLLWPFLRLRNKRLSSLPPTDQSFINPGIRTTPFVVNRELCLVIAGHTTPHMHAPSGEALAGESLDSMLSSSLSFQLMLIHYLPLIDVGGNHFGSTEDSILAGHFACGFCGWEPGSA